MLGFFRKYQRYFFVVITIVIVISFSFFGTYNTLSNSSFREQIAFKAVDGTDITRRELDEMAVFLGTDAHDKLLFGGVWGPNFLNDGVIRKSFLETGLASILIRDYIAELQSDLITRAEKEKRYQLYLHPQAPFIGTEAAWNYFMPAMTSYFHSLKTAQDPSSPEAVNARIALFLMEKQFPPPLLHQVLRHQEKQQSWIMPDRNLDHTDLSIFGYHTTEDWFGPRFVRLVSQFIINAAIVAEQQGYQVTKADALADLMRNTEQSFQQNSRSPYLGVANSQEYFSEQLRRLGMDRNGAANVWRQVMLFRRFFQDVGNSVFVDPYSYQKLDAYAFESVEGEIFRLPKELHFNNFRTLQKFETYLDAVAKRSEEEKGQLALPKSFLTPAQAGQKFPELVQKRYLLEFAQVNKKSLESNVGIKESWNWEVGDAGWEKLKKQFPELGVKKDKTREERLAALDQLDSKTRGRVDAFARSAIVDAHPDWIKQALAEAPPTRMIVGLHEKVGSAVFSGLKDGKPLMKLLDAAPLAGQNPSEIKSSAKEAAESLSLYTADQAVYYHITVIERAPEPEILTFAEAEQQGILDRLLDKQLEAHYLKIRETDPKPFQKSDGNWKAFADVKEIVAERYSEKLLKAIQKNYALAIAPEAPPQQMIADYAATLRFFPYMKEMRAMLEKDPSQASTLSHEASSVKSNGDILAAKPPLAEQWKPERSPYQTSRGSGEAILDHTTLFALDIGQWTKVNAPANGDINFFHLAKKGNTSSEKTLVANISQVQMLLSDDAQQKLMKDVLREIENKGAISLDYLNQTMEQNDIL